MYLPSTWRNWPPVSPWVEVRVLSSIGPGVPDTLLIVIHAGAELGCTAVPAAGKVKLFPLTLADVRFRTWSPPQPPSSTRSTALTGWLPASAESSITAARRAAQTGVPPRMVTGWRTSFIAAVADAYGWPVSYRRCGSAPGNREPDPGPAGTGDEHGPGRCRAGEGSPWHRSSSPGSIGHRVAGADVGSGGRVPGADALAADDDPRSGAGSVAGHTPGSRRRVSPVWRRPAPGVRTAAASARREPTRTTSLVALVIAV